MKKLLLAVVFIGGLILILVWMEGGFREKVPGGRAVPTKAKAPAPETIEVTARTTEGKVTVSGTVESRENARLAARIQGYVIELNVDAGDRVKQDQTLLRIDNKDALQRVMQAQANLESAKADFAEASADYERYKSLLEKESISQKEFDRVEARYEMAKAAVSRAEAAVDEARTVKSYGVVTAPFDGIVSERSVNLGDLITPGALLFKVYKPGTAELVAAAGEQYAPFLAVGKPVTVRIPSLNFEQKTSIEEVVPQRDVRTRTITVKAPLKQAQGLVPGLYGILTFETRSSKTLVIPRSAVKIVGQLETVYVYEDDTVKTRHVRTGRSFDNGTVEVLSGLNKGERLVVEPE